MGWSARRQSQDRINEFKDASALHNQIFQAKPSQMKLKSTYNTKMKQTLMTGPQAACVYYGPAARNPLQIYPRMRSSRISKESKLASEKFVFQKATKLDSPQRREFQSKMSVKTSPFDQFEAADNTKMSPKWAQAGGGKQATQFYQTAYVQNAGGSWVDKKTIDETSFEMTQMEGVEPSVMFDELNQT